MGVDLKLLVVNGDCGAWAFSHCLFEYGRYYELFDDLNVTARPLPAKPLHSYVARIPDGSREGEPGYGEVTETPYGEPLTYVTAAQFLEAAREHPPHEKDRRALAALAYLGQLEGGSLVGLYYH